MRGRAYRRQQARNKYLHRAKQIYNTYGGYKIVGDRIVKCESITDYLESANLKLLKSQGSFDHHSNYKQKKRYNEHGRYNSEIDISEGN